jgi:hypothetical protein
MSWRADFAQKQRLDARRILGIVETERCGDPAIESQKVRMFSSEPSGERCQAILAPVVLELPLLVLDVGQHLAHEVRLINLGETLADAVGALVQANGTDTATAPSSRWRCRFRPDVEQHIAARE